MLNVNYNVYNKVEAYNDRNIKHSKVYTIKNVYTIK